MTLENRKKIIHKKKKNLNSSTVRTWHPIHTTNNRQLIYIIKGWEYAYAIKNNGEELMIGLNLNKQEEVIALNLFQGSPLRFHLNIFQNFPFILVTENKINYFYLVTNFSMSSGWHRNWLLCMCFRGALFVFIWIFFKSFPLFWSLRIKSVIFIAWRTFPCVPADTGTDFSEFFSGEPSSFDFTPYTLQLYQCTLTRLKAADLDQEVKERAIACMGQIISHLGDHLQVKGVVY